MTYRSRSAVRLLRPCSSAILVGAAVLALAACNEMATLPVSAGTGPHPTLPPPEQTLIPTVHIAPAQGWPSGVARIAPTADAVRGADLAIVLTDHDDVDLGILAGVPTFDSRNVLKCSDDVVVL